MHRGATTGKPQPPFRRWNRMQHADGGMVRIGRIARRVVVGNPQFHRVPAGRGDRMRVSVFVLPVELPAANQKRDCGAPPEAWRSFNLPREVMRVGQ